MIIHIDRFAHLREHQFSSRQKLLYVGECNSRMNSKGKATVKDLMSFVDGHLDDFGSVFAFDADAAFEGVESSGVDGVVLVGKQNMVFPNRDLYRGFVDEVGERELGLAGIMVYGQKFPQLVLGSDGIGKVVSYPKNKARVIASELRGYFGGERLEKVA